METYYRTQEEAKTAAEKAQIENFNTRIVESTFQCDCGESFSYRLDDADTLNTLEAFVVCEACNAQYE